MGRLHRLCPLRGKYYHQGAAWYLILALNFVEQEKPKTMKNETLKLLGFIIGAFITVGIAAHQYEIMRNKINSLESALQQAEGTVKNQELTIQDGQKTLRERETEIERKEEQIREKEKQIQAQRTQLQGQAEDLKSQRMEIAEQQEIAARLRANTETLGVCLAGVTLALTATTTDEAATALTAIGAKCEEAAEIVGNL
jgi:DNA repair exonuclease SbcCD ATPase subunit